MLESKCATLIVAVIFSLLRQEDWLICLKEDVFLLNIAGKEGLYLTLIMILSVNIITLFMYTYEYILPFAPDFWY